MSHVTFYKVFSYLPLQIQSLIHVIACQHCLLCHDQLKSGYQSSPLLAHTTHQWVVWWHGSLSTCDSWLMAHIPCAGSDKHVCDAAV